MAEPRLYGTAPYRTAVLHGGPGAPGDMAVVARELSKDRGVLESLQNGKTIDDLIMQLKCEIEAEMSPPVILIGHSWGAWLAYIFAAKHPSLVKKIILVSAGPFEHRYAERIMETRLSRLDENEKKLFLSTLTGLTSGPDLELFGKLIEKTDAFDPLIESNDEKSGIFIPGSYRNIWEEADRLRKSGELLELGRSVRCPVTAIHGDHDPHPAEGVEKPLAAILGSFQFILIEKCGHYPWKEKQAKEKFYSVLENELSEK